MSSIEQRLAAVTKRTANLIAQLSELNRLRDRIRKAELARRSRRISVDALAADCKHFAIHYQSSD
jgi:hypothetical protein